jgi:ribonucleoside-diphosphate reductase alpha chain
MMLTKVGGGVGIDGDKIRSRNSEIRKGRNGKSEGSIPFFKIFDSTILASNQGSTRRGAAVINQSITHGDNDEFIRIRRPQGDVDRQCPNVHHAVKISDDFMNRIESGDSEARHKWIELMKTRYETGEPYILFTDNINNNNPKMYLDKNIKVNQSNLCTEITLKSDNENSFVCCLSSVNLTKYDDWKNDSYFLFDCILFLDSVMEETIQKASSFKKNSGYDRILKFSSENRALGLGVLGWHTLLQMKNLPFDTSFPVMALNAEIFRFIKTKTDIATNHLAKWLGEPEMCKGYGVRHTHRLAVAPTVTNSRISGGVSAGVEPIESNAHADKGAKGTFFFKNTQLEKLLEEKDKNNDDTWKSIVENQGSVQHLDFLSEKEKLIFRFIVRNKHVDISVS